ncbi:MAG: hypothetical protein ACON49_08760 [Candidatus Puniceispirillaceae bacterium]
MAKEFVLRVMGESDILEVQVSTDRFLNHTAPAHDKSWDKADHANWLAHWLDGDRAAEWMDNKSLTEKMEQTALDLLVTDENVNTFLESEANYLLMLLLREKWPVGSKAGFKVTADKVGANHTYHMIYCTPQKIDSLDDAQMIAKAESQALGAHLPALKKSRKIFANSSAVHAVIKQAMR